MIADIRIAVNDIINYTAKAISSVSPIAVALVLALHYILFPTVHFIHASIALATVVCLDIITKYYSISKNNGGFLRSYRSGKLNSRKMWLGTKRKLISYFIVMILAGLSARITMLEATEYVFASVAYSVMFLRESQSIAENMIDAGHDLGWVVYLLKRKKKTILDDYVKKTKGDDNEVTDTDRQK